MSQVGMRHLTQDYQGLAFGKGALTASTSPLWSPHGAYSYGGYYGEADGSEAAAAPAAPAEEKGMLAKIMENKTMIFGYSVSTALLIAGGLWWCCLRKNAPMPLRNPWNNFGGLGSEVAHMRWGKDAKKKAAARKKLIARAKKLGQIKDAKAWDSRRTSKKYYTPKKKAKKAYTTKKDKKGRTMYYIDGKRVSKAKALGKAAAKVANPRRRRNKSSYQKFMGEQMRAGKTMKQAARMWRSHK
jgi:hypothetical protein